MVKENKELLARLNLGALPRFCWLGASLSRGIHCMGACVSVWVYTGLHERECGRMCACMCVVWEVGLEVASPTLYTSVMTKCQFGDSLSCAGLLSSRGQACIVCVPSPTPTSDHHGDVPSRRGVSNMSGIWLILSVCVSGRLIEETKSNHCWSFLPLLLHFYQLNLFRHSCFFTLLFLLHLAVFSPLLSPPNNSTHTQMCVWSHCVATSLAQVSRQECSVALQAFTVIVAFDEGQSVGQQVQVSSLTGSCPYQPSLPVIGWRSQRRWNILTTMASLFASLSCAHNGQW